MSIVGIQFRNLLCFVGMVLVLTVASVNAAAQDDIEAKNRRAVQTGFDNWRRGIGSIFDLLASDAKWTIVGNSVVAGTYHSRRDFMDQVILPFNERLSTKLVPTVRGIYTDGDMVIVLWDGAGMARDGKPYENTYSWYLQMKNGKIVNVTAFYDSIAFNDLWKRIRPGR